MNGRIVHHGRRDLIFAGHFEPVEVGAPVISGDGKMIRSLRLSVGLTLRKCAVAMGMTPTQLSSCEQERILMSLDERGRLYGACADAMGGKR